MGGRVRKRNELSNTKAGHSAQLRLEEGLPGHLHGEEWKRVNASRISSFSTAVIKHHEEFIWAFSSRELRVRDGEEKGWE